jgi:hypothetical protein
VYKLILVYLCAFVGTVILYIKKIQVELQVRQLKLQERVESCTFVSAVNFTGKVFAFL